MKKRDAARALSECLRVVNTATGRRRLEITLNQNPYPHYEPSPRLAGSLIRVDADGTRTLGRFVRRRFIPASP